MSGFPEAWVTVEQAAEMVGVSVYAIRYAIGENQIRADEHGRVEIAQVMLIHPPEADR